MVIQTETVAAAPLVSGGETTLHSHPPPASEVKVVSVTIAALGTSGSAAHGLGYTPYVGRPNPNQLDGLACYGSADGTNVTVTTEAPVSTQTIFQVPLFNPALVVKVVSVTIAALGTSGSAAHGLGYTPNVGRPNPNQLDGLACYGSADGSNVTVTTEAPVSTETIFQVPLFKP